MAIKDFSNFSKDVVGEYCRPCVNPMRVRGNEDTSPVERKSALDPQALVAECARLQGEVDILLRSATACCFRNRTANGCVISKETIELHIMNRTN